MSNMEIAGYCVYLDNEDFDHSLIGKRRHRLNGKFTVIYCETEEDANNLSGKIHGSTLGPYYYLKRCPIDPTYSGPVEY
jgi:hypothetical protein